MSNTITVTGNASVNRDLTATNSGKMVFTFSIADTARKQVDGAWVDGETTWFEVTSWEKLAESASEYVTNGRRVTVTGRLETVRYTDNSGDKRTKLVLHPVEIALNIRFGVKGAEQVSA